MDSKRDTQAVRFEDSAVDAEFGFTRPGFRRSQLAGSVEFYERHVFLRYKNPNFWPSNLQGEEMDELPRLFHSAFSANKALINPKTRVALCEGQDATDGDVLIFPDMIKYRMLSHTDVISFVEQVLVKNEKWLNGTLLRDSYVFICCHAAKDLRCGTCGPALVARFKHEIEVRGLNSNVFVSPCSHLGGHKYAGNVIIFGSSVDGRVTGHWYGYVTPDDVRVLLEEHILRGTIVNQLWRGQMGLSEDEQRITHLRRLQVNDANVKKGNNNMVKQVQKDNSQSPIFSSEDFAKGCCQQNPNSCCQLISKKTSRI